MKEIIQQIRKRITPPEWASWQTLILLSIFSALIAAPLSNAEPPQTAQRIVSSFGWIFLILGVWWFVYEPKVKDRLTIYYLFIGPWFVGALFCVYLFGTWEGRAIPTPTAFVTWPLISTVIWAIPKFIKSDARTRNPILRPPIVSHRQHILLVVLVNLVLSCWFQFHFQVQSWLQDYPILRAEDLSRSGFVYRLEIGGRSTVAAGGEALLNATDKLLQLQLQGKPWSDVERWLEQLDRRWPTLRNEIQAGLPGGIDSSSWSLEGRVMPDPKNPTPDSYNLQLQAVWQGFSSRSQTYVLQRGCRIQRGAKTNLPWQINPNPATAPRNRSVGIVQCGPIVFPDASTRPGI